jgi:DNA invertase Pin-like site-specific DNA recombinase
MSQRGKQVLVSNEETLSEWNQKIKAAIETKERQKADFQAKKQQLLPILIDAHDKGVSSRELERITGINHTTICQWIKEAKKKGHEVDQERREEKKAA